MTSSWQLVVVGKKNLIFQMNLSVFKTQMYDSRVPE